MPKNAFKVESRVKKNRMCGYEEGGFSFYKCFPFNFKCRS